jgi:peptidoglycan/LPS O-acetylase OafA/YrhL
MSEVIPKAPIVGRIDELDALRGLMAFAVMLYHLTAGLHANLPSVPVSRLSFAWGEFGVQGFFAISGFVILMTLERTERVADFLVSRFSRLFPAYWVAMLVTLCVVVPFGPQAMHRSIETSLVNVTMLQSWFGYGDVDPSYWSLGVELGFYAIMLGLWRLKMLGRVELIALGLVALRLLARLLPQWDSWLDGVTASFHMPFFFVGILAYRIWMGARSFGQQLPILILAGLNLYLSNMLQLSAVYAVVAMGMVLLVDGKLAWLKQRPLLRLGAISYPLYLVHQFVGCTMIFWLGKAGIQADLATLLTILALLALAYAIHRAVEKPALSKIRSMWRRGKGNIGDSQRGRLRPISRSKTVPQSQPTS